MAVRSALIWSHAEDLQLLLSSRSLRRRPEIKSSRTWKLHSLQQRLDAIPFSHRRRWRQNSGHASVKCTVTHLQHPVDSNCQPFQLQAEAAETSWQKEMDTMQRNCL